MVIHGGGILRREWSSTALIVVKAEGRTSQASLFRCFPRQLSMTSSMTLLGAMNSHIQAKWVCPAWESNPRSSAFRAGCSNHWATKLGQLNTEKLHHIAMPGLSCCFNTPRMGRTTATGMAVKKKIYDESIWLTSLSHWLMDSSSNIEEYISYSKI